MTEAEESKLPLQQVLQQSSQAINALKSHHKKPEVAKKDQEMVLMNITLKKISPKPSVKPVRLHVPHPWRDLSDSSKLSVCLIVKDPLEESKKRIPEIPCLQYVDSVKGLNNKHKPFEAKRMLCASHDLFLADERVLPCLPKILGKVFFNKKKIPVAVDLQAKNVGEEIEKAISSTYMHLSSGPCVSIKIGTISQDTKSILDNLEAVIHQLDKKLPEGGLQNIRAISLKTSESISLPVFELKI